jgi:PleD family two-component response regulator
MASAERSVLIVGEDLARVDAIVPVLRRLNLDVRRAVRASAASKIVHEAGLELVVVVLPFPQARDFLTLLRSPRSPCRHAAVLPCAAVRRRRTTRA